MTVSTVDALLEEGRSALRALVGRDDADFREGQWDAVRALVADRGRVLVVQRTGWGKSAVYFVATALLRARGTGPTLIVSPLLALMRDQIAAATRAGVRAVTMNSANAHEWDVVAAALAADEVDVLLVSPERLENPRFRAEQLPRLAATCGLVVVDEAHCISDWGHDFRPDYRRIRDLLTTLPAGTPVLATTATANARVVADVAEQLATPAAGEVTVLRGPLARTSLRLGVLELPVAGRSARLARGAPRRAAGQRHRLHPHRVRRAGRRRAPRRRRAHRARLHRAAPTPPSARPRRRRCGRAASRRWWRPARSAWASTSPTSASSCTSGAPSSPVAYYQQVGRAGRAIDRADVLLLPGAEDRDIWRYFATASMPRPEQAAAVLGALADRGPAAVDRRAGDGDRRPPHPARAAAQGARRRRRGRAGAGRLARHRAGVGVRRRALRTGGGRPGRRGRGDARLPADDGLPDALPRRGARRPGRRRLRALRPLRRALVPDVRAGGGPATRRRHGCARWVWRSRHGRSGRPAWTGWASRSRAGSRPPSRSATGRALARLTDLGWGSRLRALLADVRPGRAGRRRAARRLRPGPRRVGLGPPAGRRRDRAEPAPSAARRRAWARTWPGSGGSPWLGPLAVRGEGPRGEPGGNSAFRLAGLWDAFDATPEQRAAHRRARRRARAARRRPRRLALDAHRRRPGAAAGGRRRRAPLRARGPGLTGGGRCCSPRSPPPPRPSPSRPAGARRPSSWPPACARPIPVEVPIVAGWLAGQPRQRRTGLGWASLRDLPPPRRSRPTLTVLEVDAALDEAAAVAGVRRRAGAARRAAPAAGPRHRARAAAPRRPAHRGAAPGRAGRRRARGRRGRRRRPRRARPPRRHAVRRPAAGGGRRAVRARRSSRRSGSPSGSPLAPMLAQSAPDLAAALDRTGPAAVEWKLDGVRVQVHRDGDDVAVFTRTLDDITDRVPEVVEAARSLAGEQRRPRRRGHRAATRRPAPALPGHLVACRPAGRRAGPRRGAADHGALRRAAPRRRRRPRRARPACDEPRSSRSPRPRCSSPGTSSRTTTCPAPRRSPPAPSPRGHEGVVVKATAAPYAMGRRGAGWVKVKPRHHPRPRDPRGRVGARPPVRAGSPTSTSAPATPPARTGRPAASSCSARRSRA